MCTGSLWSEYSGILEYRKIESHKSSAKTERENRTYRIESHKAEREKKTELENQTIDVQSQARKPNVYGPRRTCGTASKYVGACIVLGRSDARLLGGAVLLGRRQPQA